MTNLLESNASNADAIAAASHSDKLTHDYIATHCPAVSYRADSCWQTHAFTAERRNDARREVIYAAIAMQSEVDKRAATSVHGADVANVNWTPELDANDYAGYAVCAAIGLVFGLVIASLTVAAVLSNLPQ